MFDIRGSDHSIDRAKITQFLGRSWAYRPVAFICRQSWWHIIQVRFQLLLLWFKVACLCDSRALALPVSKATQLVWSVALCICAIGGRGSWASLLLMVAHQDLLLLLNGAESSTHGQDTFFVSSGTSDSLLEANWIACIVKCLGVWKHSCCVQASLLIKPKFLMRRNKATSMSSRWW